MDTTIDRANHPCFSDSARHRYGRVHLPIAPRCNIQCNFCNRRYDCVNESRPGVTSVVLSPVQALSYLRTMVNRDPRIRVVGIAGPGDPFANPAETMETLRLVRREFPHLLLCVASNGLNVLPYVDELRELQVSHVTVTINAVDAAVGEKVYAWTREGKVITRGKAAAQLLIERQKAAVAALKKAGITVKINTIIIPGVNEEHIPAVARGVAALGADVMNCIPLYPAKDSVFESIVPPTAESVARVRAEIEQFLPLMYHCTRCRADAAGLLGEGLSADALQELQRSALLPANGNDERPYVAVASREGVLVNQHLGEAEELLVFGEKDGSFVLVERRKTPSRGGGDERWEELSRVVKDCRMVLVGGVGDKPTRILEKNGVQIVMMEGLIDAGLAAAFGKGDFSRLRRTWGGCGSSCAGNSRGCS